MGDEIEKLLKHENIPLFDENQVTNAKYMDILHRSRGQFYSEIEQLAKLQVGPSRGKTQMTKSNV